MDTGATSYLASYTRNLSSITNNCIINCVLVGSGRSILVTHFGHSKLHTPHRPLHLHNILVTPNIIKNLIFVCRFTYDNKISNEFDPIWLFCEGFGNPSGPT